MSTQGQHTNQARPQLNYQPHPCRQLPLLTYSTSKIPPRDTKSSSTQGMAYPPMYPYPYYYYPPNLYHTTTLSRSFPEHHLPFEHARHKLTSGLHNILNDTYPAPRADVRETLKNYYIDIELPGVECKDQIKLKWMDSRTLHLEVEKEARVIVDSEDDKTAATTAATGIEVQEGGEGKKTGTVPENDESKHVVHEIVKERDLGRLKRSFYFPVSVNREGLTAKLHHGILEITLSKDDHQSEKHEVAIEHDGA
jgi:HSP20 family molecular chaperone IbpA